MMFETDTSDHWYVLDGPSPGAIFDAAQSREYRVRGGIALPILPGLIKRGGAFGFARVDLGRGVALDERIAQRASALIQSEAFSGMVYWCAGVESSGEGPAAVSLGVSAAPELSSAVATICSSPPVRALVSEHIVHGSARASFPFEGAYGIGLRGLGSGSPILKWFACSIARAA